MKNKISLKTGFLLMFLTLFGAACQKDVLDTNPKGVLAEGVSSAGTVDKMVTAAYEGLAAHFFGNGESFLGPVSNWVIDVRSDDAYKGGGGISDLSDVHQLETATMVPTNGVSFNKWRNNLFAIARTNMAIREIIKLKDDTYPKDSRIGEMKLLRAFFHFDLARNFKKVPYLDENSDPAKTSNVDLTYDALMSKIEADLLAAYSSLPAAQTEIGRVNKYVAAASLAKLYVETKKWAEAIKMCDAVISSGLYGLEPEFENLSKLAYENGQEAVFTIQYSTANSYANHDWSDLLNVTTSPGIDAGGYANGDGFYLGSQNLVNCYRTDANGLPLFDNYDDVDVKDGSYAGTLDPRVDFTFGRWGIPWKGTAVFSSSWVRSHDYDPGFSCKKHIVAPNDPSINKGFPWAASGLNFMLIRYSEVLLWKAEALIESNGDLDAARILINKVRNRAASSTPVKKLGTDVDAANYKVGQYPSSGWTQDYARKALRFERRIELAMEGHRFYDLNRWGVAATVMNAYYQSEGKKAVFLAGKNFVAGKHEYLPIPQSEIDLAPLMIKQNDNY